MTTQLSPLAIQHFTDNNGNLLAGGQLYTYAAGTSTPLATYTDSTGGTANANPVIMNARGEANVWTTSGLSYKFVLQDASGVTIWTVDNITDGSLDSALAAALANTTDPTQGAALVGQNTGYAGDVGLTIQQAAKYGMVNLRQFGAKFDGATDDTTAIQAALNSGAPYLLAPSGTTICGPLFGTSGTTLVMTSKTVFMARAGFGVNDQFINLTNIAGFVIHGNGATVTMPKAEYTSGEQRHGVLIQGCSNVTIYDLHSNDSGGDGFYIGSLAGVQCSNIRLVNCYADNNRRQGLSITGVIGCWVEGGAYTNTIGTAPEGGIDVEPNASDVIQNVNIVGVRTAGNNGAGIIVAPILAGATAGSIFGLTIRDCLSDGDGANTYGAFHFDNSGAPTNPILGRISMSGCAAINSPQAGLCVGATSWTNMPRLEISDISILNPCAAGIPATTYTVAGVLLYTAFASTDITNIYLRNVRVADNRGTQIMVYPFLIGASSGFTLKNSSLIDCDDVGTTPSSAPFVILGSGVSGVGIRQTYPRLVSYSASQLVSNSTSLDITQSVSCVLSLPAASLASGFQYRFVNSANTTMQIHPQAGDIIFQAGLTAGNDLVSRTTGDFVVLESNGTGWVVKQQFGAFSPLGFSKSGVVVYDAAAPTTGAWLQGDRAINPNPAVGSPKSWVCTVAGTPGTWVSEGNL